MLRELSREKRDRDNNTLIDSSFLRGLLTAKARAEKSFTSGLARQDVETDLAEDRKEEIISVC